jgi:peptidoglycan hydrolase-like protein with peptidoglycan-binding domain
MRRIAEQLAIAIGSLALLVGSAAPAFAVKTEDGLIRGLDGGLYQPYRPSVIRDVQQELAKQGLFKDRADGVFDDATMKAIAAFQRQHGIMVSGVPSPDTRKALSATS